MAGYFERLESSAHALADQLKAEDPNLTPEAVAWFTVALAIQTIGLAICESLGGVDNSLGALMDIDQQLNLAGGGNTETLGQLVDVIGQIGRTLDRIEGKLG